MVRKKAMSWKEAMGYRKDSIFGHKLNSCQQGDEQQLMTRRRLLNGEIVTFIEGLFDEELL